MTTLDNGTPRQSQAEQMAEQLQQAGADESLPARPLEYHFQPESPRILVVDDERVIREILSDFLSVEGYLVRTVEDGAEALKELQRRSYNMVISDLKMPNMGGLELLKVVSD